MKVELDPDVLKLLQEGHGGWNDLMFEVECTTSVTSSSRFSKGYQ